MNEAQVPITPNPGADFRTQVLTLVERLVLAAEENEPLRSSLLEDALEQSYKEPQILYDDKLTAACPDEKKSDAG